MAHQLDNALCRIATLISGGEMPYATTAAMTATTAATPVGSVMPPATAATRAPAAEAKAATDPIFSHVRRAGDGPLAVGVSALPAAVTPQR